MNKQLKIALALAFLVAAATIALTRPAPGRVELPDTAFYYDLDAAELFTAPVSDPGQGVRAHVISCGSCDAASREIGYLTTYTEEAIEALKNPVAQTDPAAVAQAELIFQGERIAAPPAGGQPPQWVPTNSPEGRAILTALTRRCPGRSYQTCQPD